MGEWVGVVVGGSASLLCMHIMWWFQATRDACMREVFRMSPESGPEPVNYAAATPCHQFGARWPLWWPLHLTVVPVNNSPAGNLHAVQKLWAP